MTAGVVAQYQLFDALRDEEYEALKRDIQVRGVLVAVELDEDGNVLDGHHRVSIAMELGIDYPTVVRAGLTEDAKREHVLKLNLLRRHLTPIKWAQAFERLAEVRGVRLGVQGRQEEKTATVAVLAAEVGVSERTARDRLALWDEVKGDPDLVAELDENPAKEKNVRREKRERARKEALSTAAPVVLPDRVDIFQGDFRTALADVADSSIDAIITDPPYPAEYLPLYEDLGWFAHRLLRDGGSLFVMSGQSYLPDIYRSLIDPLSYQWTVAYMTPGAHTQIWGRQVSSGWKPVVWLTKGKYSGGFPLDVVRSEIPDKEHHDWGQSETGMAALVERFTKPGDLILDPFLGAGTTGVVAVRLGRQFIGCDIDPLCVEQSRRRIADARP